MSSISHPPTSVVPERRHRSVQFLAAEMWASLAITAMWIAVAVTSVWGPDFVSNSGPGGRSTTIPSGIAVALFACIGSWAVAKHGFARATVHHPRDWATELALPGTAGLETVEVLEASTR